MDAAPFIVLAAGIVFFLAILSSTIFLWIGGVLMPYGLVSMAALSVLFCLAVARSIRWNKRVGHEMAQLPGSYQQTGGLRIGQDIRYCTNATWPFASIAVAEEAIVILCLGKKHTFAKEEVTALKKYSGLISTGLKIEHRKHMDPYVVFWTFSYDELRQNLERRGWVFSEDVGRGT